MPVTDARQLRPWMTQIDGQQLRRLRRQASLSQADLAERAGVSVATVARLERKGCSTCRGRTLARLAAALGESPGSITGTQVASGK